MVDPAEPPLRRAASHSSAETRPSLLVSARTYVFSPGADGLAAGTAGAAGASGLSWLIGAAGSEPRGWSAAPRLPVVGLAGWFCAQAESARSTTVVPRYRSFAFMDSPFRR